jgi:hypothetical protein
MLTKEQRLRRATIAPTSRCLLRPQSAPTRWSAGTRLQRPKRIAPSPLNPCPVNDDRRRLRAAGGRRGQGAVRGDLHWFVKRVRHDALNRRVDAPFFVPACAPISRRTR